MMLEEGMIIYCENKYADNLSRYVINRVTKTQAIIILNNNATIRFNREQKGNSFFEKGSTGYYKDLYFIETPDLKKRYIKGQLLKRCKSINFNMLNNAQLTQILNIAWRKENEKEKE